MSKPAPAQVIVASSVKIPIAAIQLSQLEPQLRRREHFKKEDLTELAESIKTKGLICPITVRPIETGAKLNGKPLPYFELVAGERRFLATKQLKLSDIEAIVRDLDDENALEVQLHENLKRVDVQPLDEAFSYDYLLKKCSIEVAGIKRPYTVADIAAKFAKTEKIIFRRLKLTDLCDLGKKDLAKGKLPLAHAEIIARFPEAEQMTMLKSQAYYGGVYDGNGSVKALAEFKRTVADRYLRILAKAPFDLDDATLNVTAGACSGCPKRSAALPALFAEDFGEDDKCPDSKCWSSKQIASVQQKREKIAGERPNPKGLPIAKLANNVPLIKDSYYEPQVQLKAPRYVKYSNYQSEVALAGENNRCEFTEKGLWISGDKFGKSQYVCLQPSKCKQHKPKGDSSDRKWKLESKEREVDTQILQLVRSAVVAKKLKSFDFQSYVATPVGRKDLLLSLGESLDYYGKDALKGLPGLIPDSVRTKFGGNREVLAAAINELSDDEVNTILGAFMFKTLGATGYGTVDRDKLNKAAKEAKVNVELVSAEAAVQLAPRVVKEAAQKHLELVKAGKPSKRPAFYWPEPKAKKVEAKPKAKAKAKGAAA
jgi:ParB/RepB/Spo0J family partition protein